MGNGQKQRGCQERRRARGAYRDKARTTCHNHPRLDTYDVNTSGHSEMSL